MIFKVHNICGKDPVISEYESLTDMEKNASIAAQDTFHFMMKQGMTDLSCGKTVYEIIYE